MILLILDLKDRLVDEKHNVHLAEEYQTFQSNSLSTIPHGYDRPLTFFPFTSMTILLPITAKGTPCLSSLFISMNSKSSSSSSASGNWYICIFCCCISRRIYDKYYNFSCFTIKLLWVGWYFESNKITTKWLNEYIQYRRGSSLRWRKQNKKKNKTKDYFTIIKIQLPN